MAARSNSGYEEQNWLADNGANAHITNQLGNLQIQQPFQQTEEVAIGNGTGLKIKNTGSSLVQSPNSASFQLKDVLHCSQASANLLSIQKFCTDNHCYFILTISHYFVKDLLTYATLLEGRSEGGLYPLQLGTIRDKGTKTFTALIGLRTTSVVWHFRLGHPVVEVVNHVVKDNSLPISSINFNKTSSCTFCQLGKGRQQPFQTLNRVTFQHLELVHSDVWTSHVQSVSGYKYHVIFIGDFSRITWIYPMYKKSEVFTNFVKFKLLVEN